MRKFDVDFRPIAEADLLELYRYIADESGHDVAGDYIGRIEAACMSLETFPERGTRRDDIRPGLRTMGFERRATIVFQVTETAVVITRVFYGGQDYERALRGAAAHHRSSTGLATDRVIRNERGYLASTGRSRNGSRSN